ncbi:hypothetical protein GQ55_1G239300 [Panicum hallii var. hallii]|uniref:Uncharacterized protein n=1 Tax=Panicum hallii var. hallii TaxID=1504633 RepID=A0A2T7F6W6_9POAL|nr:hypothetical protein GQ55_1G239300 [Panicum hallii var. hallii]
MMGILTSGVVCRCPPRVRMSRKLRRGRMRRPAYRRLLFAAFAVARITVFPPRVHIRPVHWSLRVNYSSGNLHLFEAYFFFLAGSPAVAHYDPRDHLLEKSAPRRPLEHARCLRWR